MLGAHHPNQPPAASSSSSAAIAAATSKYCHTGWSPFGFASAGAGAVELLPPLPPASPFSLPKRPPPPLAGVAPGDDDDAGGAGLLLSLLGVLPKGGAMLRGASLLATRSCGREERESMG